MSEFNFKVTTGKIKLQFAVNAYKIVNITIILSKLSESS